MSLRVEELSVRYGQFPVLRDISFTIGRGEVLCVIGPNGSGKSTLIKTIAGIIPPASGSVFLDDVHIRNIPGYENAKKIGYVPQDFLYLSTSSVLEAVILGRRPHLRWSLSQHDLDIVDQALDLMNLSALSGKILTELSGGERQRVFIARAIAQEPDIFLFDEPTSALDIRHQIDVFSLIRKLSIEQNRSVLVAVHDLNFAYQYADRVILLDKGKIISSGTQKEVMTIDHIRTVYGVVMEYVTTDAGTYILPVWNRGREDAERIHKRSRKIT